MVDSPTRQGNGAAGEQVAPLPIFYRRPRPLNSEVDRGKYVLADQLVVGWRALLSEDKAGIEKHKRGP